MSQHRVFASQIFSLEVHEGVLIFPEEVIAKGRSFRAADGAIGGGERTQRNFRGIGVDDFLPTHRLGVHVCLLSCFRASLS